MEIEKTDSLHNKDLIKLLKDMLEKAKESSLSKKYIENTNYYYGKADKKNKIPNCANIIKPIVDAKATFTLDNHIITSIVPKVVHFSDLNNIEDNQKLADILEDCKNNVFILNNINTIKEKVVRDAIISEGIVKIYWDQDINNGLGDVKLENIDSSNIFIDPNAKSLETANYIFLRVNTSTNELKKKYPEFLIEIDKLSNTSSSSVERNIDYNTIVTGKTDQTVWQMYTTSTNGKNISRNIEVWECYLKDDTIFMPSDNDSDLNLKAEEIKNVEFKYPEGRCIIFAGENLILEDKAMRNPFVSFKETITDSVVIEGDTVKDLIFIQDRINASFYKLEKLMKQLQFYLAIDSASGLMPEHFINQSILLLDANSLANGLLPQPVQNNTISAFQQILDYIEYLKKSAKEISRINDSMLSGEKQKGVNSGAMVQALDESALTGIRQIQRNFSDFMINLTRKILRLIQDNYSIGRVVKLSTGNEYAIIPGKDISEDNLIKTIDSTGKILSSIKGNIDLGNFDVEIISGTEMPKTRASLSQLTLMLIDRGVFGNPNDIETRELILKTFDYPNWREISKKFKEKEDIQLNNPPAPPPIEKINLSFKDMESFPEAQANILNDIGLLNNMPNMKQFAPESFQSAP